MNDTQLTVLHGHTSPETAHLTFAYPFGRSIKCVRREWVERATKGTAKGQDRFVIQTTVKLFNGAYTAILENDGPEKAEEFARFYVAQGAYLGRPLWNATKAGTYVLLAVMVESPLEDGSGRIGTSYVALSLYDGPDHIAKFMARVGHDLDEAQAKRVRAIEALSRRLNPNTWAEYEAKQVPV